MASVGFRACRILNRRSPANVSELQTVFCCLGLQQQKFASNYGSSTPCLRHTYCHHHLHVWSHDKTKQSYVNIPPENDITRKLSSYTNSSNSSQEIAPPPHLIAGKSVDSEGVGVAPFRRHWERVLGDHGVPEPMWSVRWILEHVLRGGGRSIGHVMQKRDHVTQNGDHVMQERDHVIHNGSKKEVTAFGDVSCMTPDQVAMATKLLTQRLKRVPVQYLIGEWDFRNVTLTMRPPVFVPTPETEELVGHVIHHCSRVIKRGDRGRCEDEVSGLHGDGRIDSDRHSMMCGGAQDPVMVADMCCGSGAIAVSLLQECPWVEVFAIDASTEAVGLTEENARRNGVFGRLTVKNMSILDAAEYFVQEDIRFDCIASNPPYLNPEEMAVLQPEIARYMDGRALSGGVEGLDQAMEVMSTCRHYLEPQGCLWLEMGHMHLQPIKSLILNNPQWRLKYESHHLDFSNRSRFHKLRLV